jgi:glycosyltransferase involved in cell wall biosynthesis
MAKLLLVIDCLGSGGAQRQLTSLAKNFKVKGHEVEFFIYHPQLLHFEHELIEQKIVVHKYFKTSRFSLMPIFSLLKILKKGKFDGALAFMHTPAIYLEIAYCLLRCFGKNDLKIVFSERTTYDEHKKLSPLFRISQQLHRCSHSIVTNSHHQRNKMMRYFPWMKNKLLTIYNGLDDSSFIQSDTNHPEEDFLLCISRVVEYKNYKNVALSLIHYQKKWGVPPKIIWVGKVFETTANLKMFQAVQTLLATHGLSDKLCFIGESSNVQRYYQNATALIHPSFIEGFSNVVMEACHYQLPLLLGNIGDHAWLLEQFPAGGIFDVNNPEDIAQSLRKFELSDTETKIAWAMNAKKANAALFSITKATDEYLTLMVNNDEN